MRRIFYYFSFIVLFVVIGCHSSRKNQISSVAQKQVTIPKEFLGKLSLFILVGQSNMSGRGELPETPQSINPRVFVFGNDYKWHYAVEPIDSPVNQVDSVSIDTDAGYSLATGFANTLLKKNPELVIGFIPCAKGGSSIQKWQRNLSDQSLYGSCLKRARAASTVGQIAGVLVCQGPADARDPAKYPKKLSSPFEWKKKFTRFVNDIRMDLGIPNLPVVFSQMGRTSNPAGWPYWELVKKQQAEVSIPNTIMTTSMGLPLSAEVHLTSKGYDILGKRFAEAFWRLTRGEKNERRK